jgi:hypothetical protein
MRVSTTQQFFLGRDEVKEVLRRHLNEIHKDTVIPSGTPFRAYVAEGPLPDEDHALLRHGLVVTLDTEESITPPPGEAEAKPLKCPECGRDTLEGLVRWLNDLLGLKQEKG